MARSQEETPGQHPVMSAAMFHVLLALADGEKHGYAILKEVKRRTGGKVQLSAGTLYGIIKRLHGEDWIVESNDRPAAASMTNAAAIIASPNWDARSLWPKRAAWKSC